MPYSLKKLISAPGAPSGPKHPDFERALTRVFELLPRDYERRELLRPIPGEREERLHELAVRARRYRRLLAAWEELHVVVHENGKSYVRDDVIQQLRRYWNNNELQMQISATRGLAHMVHTYESYRYFLAQLAGFLFPWTAPYFADHMTLHSHVGQGGRGIVFTVGNRQAEYLLSSIPSIRELGCTLPIEIMYMGDQDLREDFRIRLEALDAVTTRNMAQIVDGRTWNLAGWSSKPFSILVSSFREVLFIDADCFFFRNPEHLFDGPGYNETGALFFRDRKVLPEERKDWLRKVLPKPISETAKRSRFWTGVSGHEQESGVLLVDKWRHFVALLMATRLNGREYSYDQGGVGIYDMVHGDKETYWLSWELVGDVDYSFHQGAVGGMGVAKVNATKREESQEAEEGVALSESGERPAVHSSNKRCDICSSQILHLDLDGMPLWVNGWVLKNKYVEAKDWEYGIWEHYAAEPLISQEPSDWQFGKNNYCCLTVSCHSKMNFTTEHQARLTALINKAKEVGVALRRNMT